MSDYSTITVSRSGKVATLTLNRPDAMNAVNVPMRRELHTALDEIGRDPEVAVVVIAANGRAFSSGADLKGAASNPDQSLRRTARTLIHDFQPILELISRMDKPVIAAVNGAAVGIGLSIALSADLLVMADNAYLMSPFVNVGLIPDGAAAWVLCRRLGYVRAFEALIEAEKLKADFCLSSGLANRVVAADELHDEAQSWAENIAKKPPLALAMTKRVARLSMSMNQSEVLTMEAELQSFLAVTGDAKEAISAFAEKRMPVFKGE